MAPLFWAGHWPRFLAVVVPVQVGQVEFAAQTGLVSPPVEARSWQLPRAQVSSRVQVPEQVPPWRSRPKVFSLELAWQRESVEFPWLAPSSRRWLACDDAKIRSRKELPWSVTFRLSRCDAKPWERFPQARFARVRSPREFAPFHDVRSVREPFCFRHELESMGARPWIPTSVVAVQSCWSWYAVVMRRDVPRSDHATAWNWRWNVGWSSIECGFRALECHSSPLRGHWEQPSRFGRRHLVWRTRTKRNRTDCRASLVTIGVRSVACQQPAGFLGWTFLVQKPFGSQTTNRWLGQPRPTSPTLSRPRRPTNGGLATPIG